MVRLIKLILLCCTVSALLPHAGAFAQNGMTLGVAPSLISVNVDERKDTYAYPLSAFNDGSTPIQVKAGFYDFSLDTKGKISFISGQAGKKSWSAATWLTLSIDEFTLQPGEERQLSLLIKPPPGAEAGTHRALITFGTAITQAKQGEVPIRAKVSTLVLITVAGKSITEPRIDFDLPRIAFFTPELDLTVRNTGNTHFFAEGYVRFLNRKNEPLSKQSLDVPKQGALVLPEAKRSFTVGWTEAPYFGFYTAEVKVMITGGRALVKRQDFFILRWELPLAVMFFVFLCLIAYRFSARYKIVPRD